MMASESQDAEVKELFQGMKYYVSGTISEDSHRLLQCRGGQRMNYFSDFVTHCIVGNDALESDITDAVELYEVPALKEEWILLSVKCNALLPTKPFLAEGERLFSGVIACVSQLCRADYKSIWGMITFHGGKIETVLHESCTHLIVSKAEGAKYETALQFEDVVRIVTPDWVVDSVRNSSRCEEELYHPRLLISAVPPSQSPPSTAADGSAGAVSDISRAQLLGFVDESFDDSSQPDTISSSKASLLEQLKQRMPWNQPIGSSQVKVEPTEPEHEEINVAKKQQPDASQPSDQQEAEKNQLLGQQQLEEQKMAITAVSVPKQLQLQQIQQLQQQKLQQQQQQLQQQIQIQQQLQQLQLRQQHGQQQQIQQPLPQQQIQQQVLQQQIQQPVPQQQILQQQQIQHVQQQQIQQAQQQQIQQVQQQQIQQVQQQQIQQVQQQQIQQVQQQQIQQVQQQQIQQVPQQQIQQQVQQVQQQQVQQHQIHQVQQHQIQQIQQQQIQQVQQQQIQQVQQQQMQQVQQQHIQQQHLQLLQQQRLGDQNMQTVLLSTDGMVQGDANEQKLRAMQVIQQQRVIPSPQRNTLPLVQQQQQIQKQQFLLRTGQQQMLQPQQIQQSPSTMTIQRERITIRESITTAVGSQIAWQQSRQLPQQQQQQFLLQQRQQQPQQVWSQQPSRQFVLDAATHAQLQQMDPQQRALFLQKLKSQNIVVLQNKIQLAQQQRVGLAPQQQYSDRQALAVNRIQQIGPAINGVGASAVITRQGDTLTQNTNLQSPQLAQVQFQQQLSHEAIAKTDNIAVPQEYSPHATPQRQVVNQVQSPQQIQLQQTQQQEPQSPQLQLSQSQQSQQIPLQQTQVQQIQLQQAQASQLQIHQSNQAQGQLQQVQITQNHLHLQNALQQQQIHGQASVQQAAKSALQSQPPSQMTVVTGISPQQQAAIVNTKTRTALANMLSGRIQAGTPRTLVGPQEGSAANQLRLMTEQHQSRIPQTPNNLTSTEFQQSRRTLSNITNSAVPINSRPSVPVLATPSVGKPGSSQVAMAAPVRPLVKAGATPRQLETPVFFGHDPNLKIPPDFCLLGCIFIIVEYDQTMSADIPTWKRIIVEHGGEVEDVYSPKVTHVLCQTLRNSVVQLAIREGKRCVTAYWLNDILAKKKVVPPFQALHLPLSYTDEKPCKNLIITQSGFEGDDRVRVRHMIEDLGAKYTSYLSRQNNVLICRKPIGVKYKKAREWNMPIVSVLWLNDILLGFRSGVRQPDNPKYQQFNVDNPFNIDYAHVPLVLVSAWKVPIQITQESYNKVRSAPPLQNCAKRRKVEDQEPLDEKINEASKEVEQVPAVPLQGSRPKVMFSTVKDLEGLQKKVFELDGLVVDTADQATHLVMTKGALTIKLLCCISTCNYIVMDSWLHDSYAQKKFLEETPYIFRDKVEQNLNICISDVLKIPNRNELFKGKTFYLTPAVVPSRHVLRAIIECAGGTVEVKKRSVYSLGKANLNPDNYFIIGVENDMHLVRNLCDGKITAYDPSAVFLSILHQKSFFDVKSTS